LKNRVSAMTLAVSTSLKATEKYSAWTTSKIDSASYLVKGDGLGFGAAGLTVGEWRYYTATAKMEPTNESAMALSVVLSGRG
jgi:hypothetical protein